MQLLQLGQAIGRGVGHPLGMQSRLPIHPGQQPLIAFESAHRLSLEVVDQRPRHPVPVHFPQELLGALERRGPIAEMSHADIGVENRHPGSEIQGRHDRMGFL